LRYETDPSFLNTRFTIVNEDDRENMLQLIKEFDVVWIHTMRTANEFRIYRWPRSVLDIDDIQSRRYASVAYDETNMLKKILNYRMSLIWRRREQLMRHRFDVLSVCSKNDRGYLGDVTRTQVIPNGFDVPSKMPNHAPTSPARIGFIGPFGYMPNSAGVEWFIRNVWPRIKLSAPNTRLRLIGVDSDKGFPEMGADIDGLGYVENPADEIASWSAMIVPIKVGAGTRVKIAEAFSRKCPVVSTTLGAFGYEVVNGKEIILADNAEAFSEACLRIISDRDLADRISENAWQRFLSEWTWDSIGKSVESAVRSCLNLRV
jgi:glycosyltransferase involved in cell wall biosynthesis